MGKIDVNTIQIGISLRDNYAVIGEGIQSRLKVLGIADAYEKIKEITRVGGGNNDKEQIKTNIRNYN